MAKEMTEERLPVFIGSSKSAGNQPWIVQEGREILAPGSQTGTTDDGLPIYNAEEPGTMPVENMSG